MKLWSGIITDHLDASKAFYVRAFGCEVVFESEWFVLLQLGDSQLGFLTSNHESQAPIFQRPYLKQGAWIAIDVDDVDAEYDRIRSLDIPIEVPIRDEPWGDRHFVIVDPNGVGVDIVKHTVP